MNAGMSTLILKHSGESLLQVVNRGLAIWFVIAAAETIHGILRRLLLEPMMGDMPARQASVFTGSVIILAISFVFVRWLKGNRPLDFVAVGVLWVILTLGFEIGLGRLAMGLSWERILSDYDLAHGGLMPIGLVVMLVSPLIAAKLADEI